MKLHHLRDFVAIADAHSVRGAARALGLAQPALTRSLRELEGELGTPLLERHARGVVLTPIGQAFYGRAHAAMAELQRGREEVAQLLGTPSGTVTVGLSSAVWLAMAAQAHQGFRKKYPGVRLRMVEGFFSMLEGRLQDGTLDFFIGPRPARAIGDGYKVDLLFHNDRVVVGRKGHPRRHATSLAELVGEDWILTGVRERVEAEFEDAFASQGLPPPVPMTQAESMVGVAALLSSTDALAMLPRQWLQARLFDGVIESIPVREHIEGPDIVQISRAGVPLTPAAAHLSTLFERVAVSM
ncbi:LysR substrate-binding domain-containing protein [Pigmentiphaga sp.]|uniref:LysR substrate-binding domain-containing protein n=1 Tax=Pigmentiphaga sp. TaxID=1977564 RepID=UPI00128B7C75|nr:LysR substrate-binding domain-containing protein [Pigmentiphaga sp.]MPS29179.1 LysR family transcriptional regulator [Alcaligenaceae bacterium SAGV5]MPS50475.1 LysR family transcriptional regulator [Alcaligenaceae bacterium SAGV3]MPT59782.1 LysR family transcriptional regulator [Alcaligenaceae bacterium]